MRAPRRRPPSPHASAVPALPTHAGQAAVQVRQAHVGHGHRGAEQLRGREGGQAAPGAGRGWGQGRAALTSSSALVSTLKPWLVSMVCRLSRLESMASRCSLSSVLARAGGAGQAELQAPPGRCLPAGAHTHQPGGGVRGAALSCTPPDPGPCRALPGVGRGQAYGRVAEATRAGPRWQEGPGGAQCSGWLGAVFQA